ncbi:methyl-accepting chemotaxis protein [Photobacterium lutimaris]|uniref:Methyl-accepting chemotaxis protein n=1 Tax=Photobacterium lutimaris TaxID=388278 RepID=A0A2T3J1S8_9GAMM|nr:methyl-accepting chemotaxis protein [Photobacterium lutimaris]PSU35000.1 methyl-accepting chemotaxis protein [Photobacterium lutimaris]TDR77357.1 methyl-accepting chemotaxis protein [Photobacterium lutimaris]
MQPHFFRTIKAKLYLTSLLLISAMLAFGVFESLSFMKLDKLQLAAQETAHSNTDLLILRRYEKDFLARLDASYVERFNQKQIELNARLGKIKESLAQYNDANNAEFDQVMASLNNYANQFNIIADQTTLLGLTPSEGLRGNIRSAANNTEELLLTNNDEKLYRLLLTLRRNEKDFLITKDLNHVSAFNNNLDSFLSALATSELTASQQRALRRSLIMYQMMFDELVQGYATVGLTYSEGLYGELRSNVQLVENQIDQLEQAIINSITELQSQEKAILLVGGVAITLIMTLVLLVISRTISHRLRAVNDIMQDIAQGEGNLTVRMNDQGDDELAQLSRSFDLFTSKLQAIINNIADISQQLSRAANESKSAASGSLANAEQQQGESANIATSINELLATSSEIASNINDTATAARNGQDNAVRSLEISQQAAVSIDTLANEINAAQKHIQTLETQSQNINKVTSVIRDITDQTNLLALNAAIEAARAGEHGRGFAVVADEVRQLAQRTRSSTQEIEQTIDHLLETVSQSVSAMQHSETLASDTVAHTKQAKEAADLILAAITDISDRSLQIASASEQQAAVSAEIDQNIHRIAELATHTAAAVSQTSSSSQDVANMADQLDSVVSQFKYK